MGVGSWEQGGSPLDFIHGADRVRRSLIVLFFDLVFFRCLPENFSAEAFARILQTLVEKPMLINNQL